MIFASAVTPVHYASTYTTDDYFGMIAALGCIVFGCVLLVRDSDTPDR